MKTLHNIRIAHIITTYNQVVKARQQMDMLRDTWEQYFGGIDIYHEYNGLSAWYPHRYREDHLHRHPPMRHLEGASYLIDQGVAHVLNSHKQYDYIIVSSSDVRIAHEDRLAHVIQTCAESSFELATSVWFLIGFATEFFIITPPCARRIFPLAYQTTIVRQLFGDIIQNYVRRTPVIEALFLQRALFALPPHQWSRKIYLLPGRKMVHFGNRYHSDDLGYVSN